MIFLVVLFCLQLFTLVVAVSMLALYAQSISPLFFVILFFKLQFPCSHCMPKVYRLCFSLSYSSSWSFHALTVCPKYLAFIFRYLILQVAVSMLALYAQSISPLFFVILFFKLQFPCSHCMPKVSRLYFSLSFSSSCSFHALTVCPKYLAFIFRYLILQVAVSMLALYAQSISPLFFVILFFKLQFPCSHCMPKVSRLCFSLSYSSSCSFHALTVCPKYLAFVFRYLILQVAVSMLSLYAQSISPLFFVILFFKLRLPLVLFNLSSILISSVYLARNIIWFIQLFKSCSNPMQTCAPSVFFRICYGIQPRIRKYGFGYGNAHLLNTETVIT